MHCAGKESWLTLLFFPLQDVTKGLLVAIKAGDADTVKGLLDSGYLDEHVLETNLVSCYILFPDRGLYRRTYVVLYFRDSSWSV